MTEARAEIVVTGIVQGVYFRANTQRVASRLGLTGWVRNRVDGSVEVVAEGEKGAVEELVSWCRQGPPGAEVERIEVNWSEHTGQLKQFSIRY